MLIRVYITATAALNDSRSKKNYFFDNTRGASLTSATRLSEKMKEEKKNNPSQSKTL